MKPKKIGGEISEVKRVLEENPSCSLKRTSQIVSQSKTTIWRIISRDLHFRFYHCNGVKPLTPEHKAQRIRFCEWILEQPADTVESILWSDEIFFCLVPYIYKFVDVIFQGAVSSFYVKMMQECSTNAVGKGVVANSCIIQIFSAFENIS